MNCEMNLELEFKKQFILSLIIRGIDTFEEIVKNCGGLYPEDLKHLINEMMDQGILRLEVDKYSIVNYTNKPPVKSKIVKNNRVPLLPLPHPHDYDWRFTDNTSKKVVDIISKFTIVNRSVLLLGVPSVLFELNRLNKTPFITFIDYSRETIDYIGNLFSSFSTKFIEHDLLSKELQKPEIMYDVTMMDPPWYLEYYMAFITQAAYVTRIGGYILMGFLPINTRPGAWGDRLTILNYIKKVGLDVERILPEYLIYKTPPFEKKSLRKIGISIDTDWRKGDLIIFRKIYDMDNTKLKKILSKTSQITIERNKWKGFLINKYKIKIRGPFTDYDIEPRLISIESENILPTVSKRYKGREKIDLWLWDNRVFGLEGKASFLAALYDHSKKTLPKDLLKVQSNNRLLAYKIIEELLS